MGKHQDSMQKGVELVSGGNYDDALGMFERLIKKAQRPNSQRKDALQLRFYYGNCLRKSGKVIEAEKYHRQTLDAHSQAANPKAMKTKISIRKELADILDGQAKEDKDESILRYTDIISLLEVAHADAHAIDGFSERSLNAIVNLLSEAYSAIGEYYAKHNDVEQSRAHYSKAGHYGKEVVQLKEALLFSDEEILETKYKVAYDLHAAWELRQAADMYGQLLAQLRQSKEKGVIVSELNFDKEKCEEFLAKCKSNLRRRESIHIWRRVGGLRTVALCYTEELFRRCRAQNNWLTIYRWALFIRALGRCFQRRRAKSAVVRERTNAPIKEPEAEAFSSESHQCSYAIPGSFPTRAELRRDMPKVYQACLQIPSTTEYHDYSDSGLWSKSLDTIPQASRRREKSSQITDMNISGELGTFNPGNLDPAHIECGEQSPLHPMYTTRNNPNVRAPQRQPTLMGYVMQSVPHIRRSQRPLLGFEHDHTRDLNTGFAKLFDCQPAKFEPQANDWMTAFAHFTQTLCGWIGDSDAEEIKVAVLDTGIDADHPWISETWNRAELEDGGYRDFTSDKGCAGKPCDHDGHGTHCAGIILRFAPRASLYIAKIASTRESCQEDKDFGSRVAKALRYAIDQWEVNVVSMSFGMRKEDKDVAEAVKYAYHKDIVVFAAAANSGNREGIAFPARHRDVFCIHAAKESAKPSDFTPMPNSDDTNFSILGEDVLSTWPEFLGCDQRSRRRSEGTSSLKSFRGTWKYATGTSMATRLAAALAANVLDYWQIFPERLHDHVRDRYSVIRKTFRSMGRENDQYRSIVPWDGVRGRFSAYKENRTEFHLALALTLMER